MTRNNKCVVVEDEDTVALNEQTVVKDRISKVANEGNKDWRNLSAKLKSHEITNEHITNMNAWIDLEKRLVKNKTIDKHVQEQINRDREHWRNVLLELTVM